jgi:shikimate dehydrogenase
MTIDGETLLAGVMGWPIAHSRSPRLYGYWLKRYGINGAMLPLPVLPERLGDAVRGLAALGFKGANVTIPHKEAVIPFLDDVTPLARRIGAVNTITVGRDGSLSGDNSDAFGFVAHLKASAPLWEKRKPAVLLGSGGAARAVIAALIEEGVPQIRLVNRTRARATDVAAHFGDGRIVITPWEEREAALAGAGLVVNATSLGMTGKPPLEIGLAEMEKGAVAYDLVYSPLKTEFLAKAAARGGQPVDGLGMLLHQARPGFSRWFGREPEVDEALRAALVADLGL